MLTAGYAERERIKQEQGKGIPFIILLYYTFVLHKKAGLMKGKFWCNIENET